MGIRVAEPSLSAKRSRVGIADRIQQATALSMNSPSDHNDNDDGDEVKKKRKPTKLSRIKTSRSIQNVYWTLCPAARYDRGNNGNSGNNSRNNKNRRKRNDTNTNARTSTDLSRTTHPLLAAAALRRVADLRALGMTYRLRRQRGQARPSASKDRWEEQEGELARTVLLPALIRCVGDAILCDVQLMEVNGNGNESEEEEDDMMHMKYNDDGNDGGGAEDDDASDLLNMIDLEIGDECPLPTDDVGVNNFKKTRHLGPESLLDVLYGLAKLSDIKRRAANAGDGSFRPLAVATCRAIISDDEGASYVPKLWHSSLVETVWSLAVLNLRDETVLLDAIGNRLEKGDAFGKLTRKQLLTVLWSYATLDRPHQGIMRAFMRRLRKVRHQLFASDIAQAIWSAARLIERLDNEAELDDASGSSYELDVAAAQLREEAIMLCHTLSNELMSPVSNDSAEPKLLDLTAGATADIVRAFADLEIGHEAPILSALSCHLRQPKIMKHCSLDSIARLLLSFHRLGLKEETETIRILCNRFTELVHTNQCDGKTLNTILRSVVMLQPVRGDASYQSVFDAAARIINDDDRGMALCSQCNEFEISSIIWSFAKAKYVDDGVILPTG